jgi:hypothetical protein
MGRSNLRFARASGEEADSRCDRQSSSVSREACGDTSVPRELEGPRPDESQRQAVQYAFPHTSDQLQSASGGVAEPRQGLHSQEIACGGRKERIEDAESRSVRWKRTAIWLNLASTKMRNGSTRGVFMGQGSMFNVYWFSDFCIKYQGVSLVRCI